ncbi:MAG: hypothetical protein E3J54_00125 [Actinobacteria bacterium]|nr:MAG: hypothetical protein E3J54_00125 [Actinomycetota bacterium]
MELHEGYTMWGITFPVRVLANLGVKVLIISGACGSLSKQLKQGQIIIITDHLDLLPANPLQGPHVKELGQRFVDMSEPYDNNLNNIAIKAAKSVNISVKTGVYAAVAGPNFETPAEVKMLKKLGADVVGMSIVPEVITAKQMGLKILGSAIVSNNAGQKTLHEQVLKNVSISSASFVKLLQAVLKSL